MPTVSVLRCRKCDYTEIRDFQSGDYVYKRFGECKNCNEKLYIRDIYAVPPKKGRRP